MPLSLQDFQDEVTRLAAIAWPNDRPTPELADALVALLCEETGEMAREVRKHFKVRWGHGEEARASTQEIAAEVGDVLFVVARLADLCGVQLDEAEKAIFAKFHRRLQQAGPQV